jgi:hypothetical protein
MAAGGIMSDAELLGPCGDYCGGCAEYTGLVTETARQLKELVETYAYEFRAGGAFDFAELARTLQWLIDNAGCPGCRQGGGTPFCQVKVCAEEKGLSVCFECEEFPCSKLEDVADPDTLDRYARFKELGFDTWLCEQASKAADGYEIHLRRVPTLTRGPA